jgi:5'-AMP-activated protein kinase regulatory beta subunit
MTPSKSTPVEFSCHAPQAKAVFVAGTFNDWKPDVPLRQDVPNGTWAVTQLLPAGRYEYKFVIDGQWGCEPGCEHEYRGCPKCVPNDFGTMNRVLEVR